MFLFFRSGWLLCLWTIFMGFKVQLTKRVRNAYPPKYWSVLYISCSYIYAFPKTENYLKNDVEIIREKSKVGVASSFMVFIFCVAVMYKSGHSKYLYNSFLFLQTPMIADFGDEDIHVWLNYEYFRLSCRGKNTVSFCAIFGTSLKENLPAMNTSLTNVLLA